MSSSVRTQPPGALKKTAELFAANPTKLLDGKLMDNLVDTNQFY